MLFHTAQDRAVAYLGQNLDQVANWGDILQLVVLELIRKIVRSNPYEKSKYIRCILTLFNSQSNAVVYECASALVALSSSQVTTLANADAPRPPPPAPRPLSSPPPPRTTTHPGHAMPAPRLSRPSPVSRPPLARGAPPSSQTAIKAAATSYTQLLSSQSDNNIKLIVLERLVDLRKQHPKVLQDMIMDIIRGLNSANLDLRKKTLDITLSLIVPSNIVEVMQARPMRRHAPPPPLSPPSLQSPPLPLP